MDTCIKQGVMLFHSRLISERIDVPQITLELLSNVNKSDFVNEKLFTQWQLKQARLNLHSVLLVFQDSRLIWLLFISR